VDSDPLVIERGRAILADVPDTAVILGDLREPEKILADPQMHTLIDFSQPVGLLLVAVVHFVHDDEDPYGMVGKYVDALAPGSALALSSATSEHQPERIMAVLRQVYQQAGSPPAERTKPEVARFFDGLEIVPPYAGFGPEVTFAGHWGAEDPSAADDDGSRWFYGAVARKP
jgi:hypothetical protein